MARRRMLNIDLILDDNFTQELSLEAQNMYIYLNMLADDDGIVGHLKRQLRMLSKSADSVNELVSHGYVLEYDPQTLIITDWLVNNHIRGDRYTPSLEDDCRSALFITYDWRYSLSEGNEKVFTSYTSWLNNERKVNGQRFDRVSKQELKQIAKEIHTRPNAAYPSANLGQGGDNHGTGLGQGGDNPVTPVSVPVAVSGSVSVPGAVPVSVSGSGIGLGKGTYTATTSSNGGLGEVSSLGAASTSTVDNNATRENGVITGEDSGVTTSSNETEINYLFDYLNGLFDGEDIPTDNERLNKLFDTLLDKYRPEFIQQALEQLANTLGAKYPIANVQQALINHLDDTIKQVMAAQDEE